MYKIIGVDAKEYGPVSVERIRQWLSEGRVDGQTKVQAEGQTNWKRLSDVPEFASRIAPKKDWDCPKCGERLELQFDTCWRCGTAREPASPPVPGQPPELPAAAPKKWRVEFQLYRGTFESWEGLFRQAADFASDIGRERLIGISHSEDDDDGVVTVWYWSQDGAAESERKTE